MPKFRILSLDGGGIMGTFTASLLAVLEEELGGEPIGGYFDLIAGTSTGGIVAAALALGEPASRVRDFYSTTGKVVFTRPQPCIWQWLSPTRRTVNRLLHQAGLDVDYLLRTKYESEPLEGALRDFFGDRTVGMAGAARLLLPAVDLTRGDTVVFKTPHLPGRNSRDRRLLMRDVVRATTAAPTYFSHSVIRAGSAYCDGGLWANDPGLVAWVEAMKIRELCKRTCDPCFDVDEIEVLSVGTGSNTVSITPPGKRAGVGFWLRHVAELMMLAQVRGTGHELKFLLEDRLHRIDFPKPDHETWKLDSVEQIDKLMHFGHSAAHASLAKLKPIFFASKATPYVPCVD